MLDLKKLITDLQLKGPIIDYDPQTKNRLIKNVSICLYIFEHLLSNFKFLKKKSNPLELKYFYDHTN
jgi:hypothetical protein